MSEVLLCDYCGKPIECQVMRQCRACGGYYHTRLDEDMMTCYRLHRHPRGTFEGPPLHEPLYDVEGGGEAWSGT